MALGIRVGIVAPSSRLDTAMVDRVQRLAAERFPSVHLHFHPQCFRAAGHFAGTDAERVAALVEVANDPAIDAVWFGRGGYGACRIAEDALAQLTDAARAKTYLGYSDAGAILAGLYAKGFPGLVHGPMPADILRTDGEAAVARALSYLATRAGETLEPSVLEPSVVPSLRCVAFNIMTFSQLIGTPLQPDLSGHVLMLEEVSEYLYRIDRSLFHITSNPAIRKVAGIRLGRCSAIPDNDPPFGEDEVAIARHWCARAGIPYLGRADIGHDAGNKIVPFGAPASSFI